MQQYFEHRRSIQSEHGQLDSNKHYQCARWHDSYHTAVWTGSEMIIWGGSDEFNDFEHWWEIQSRHGQLDGHKHDQCAQYTILSHGSMDRQ